MPARRVILFILAVAVVATMCLTNPRRDEYIEWVFDKSRPDSGHVLSRVVPNEFAPVYMDETTTARNLGLFSLFRTDTGNENPLVVLGICKQYILIRGYRGLEE